jgi:hypothetical protein
MECLADSLATQNRPRQQRSDSDYRSRRDRGSFTESRHPHNCARALLLPKTRQRAGKFAKLFVNLFVVTIGPWGSLFAPVHDGIPDLAPLRGLGGAFSSQNGMDQVATKRYVRACIHPHGCSYPLLSPASNGGAFSLGVTPGRGCRPNIGMDCRRDFENVKKDSAPHGPFFKNQVFQIFTFLQTVSFDRRAGQKIKIGPSRPKAAWVKFSLNPVFHLSP